MGTHRHSRGFAFIESFIPIAILAILAALLVPNFIKARSRGQLTACTSNLKNIGTAYEMYSTDFEGQYPAGLSALTPNYLKTIPGCPVTERADYVSQRPSPERFRIVCPNPHFEVKAGTLHYDCEYGLKSTPAPYSGPQMYHAILGILAVFSVFWALLSQPIEANWARERLQYPAWLDGLSWVCWVLLTCLTMSGIYAGIHHLTGNRWLALAGIPIGANSCVAFIEFAWRLWMRVSPPEEVVTSVVAPGSKPRLGEGLRAEVLPDPVRQKLVSLCTMAVPGLTFLAMTLGPQIVEQSVTSLRASLLGAAVAALASLPLYLWGKRWARQRFYRELEWVPGSEQLLEHSNRAGRPVCTPVGQVDEIVNYRRVGEGCFFELNGRHYRLATTELSEAMGIDQADEC